MSRNLEPLCFSSFVFGDYQKFIPYYIYSVYKAYPQAFVKVFLEDKLFEEIKNVLDFIKDNAGFKFEIVELNTSFSSYEKFKMRGSGAKTMIRWLLDSSFYPESEYIYIGDIDIMFLKEEYSLLDFHISQANKINLPFSNKVRIDQLGITTRLTGLHFIIKEPYFNKVNPILKQLLSNESFLENYLIGLERNESFLYKLNMDAFDFNPLEVSKLIRPWHGLHLGITRGNKNVDLKIIKENSSLSIDEIKIQLNELLQDKIFQKIMNKIFVIELYVILKNLQLSVPFQWKLKVIIYKLKEYKKDFKLKLKKLINV